ncbi:hypothetical protein [Enterobacter ludwigii]|uniref:hypothetical protein n=1 Tax=Enterobacter ludwigii TaxID=299767 RepID=UPI00288BCCC5|nr:hypothetical protein [Enterobacter ludwigii]WNI47377.1 hypothetical protein RIK66_11495 [Enterobacter ludwigii]WNI56265.1 hypothetical protein RIL74_11040 [Enterobacter ludwigii]WNI79823.1 hypothetical protein RIK68_15650 [Enterobacter ludwigii]
MGMKSRLKKERRASYHQGDLHSVSKEQTSDYVPPKNIFRFFQDKEHAEALCKGDVWLTTLQRCREYDDPLQGDAKEATHTYNGGTAVLHGDGTDHDFVTKAARLGIRVCPGAKNIQISGGFHSFSIDNAYVLCTTQEFNPSKLSATFGNYCVEISEPKEFFELVSAKLHHTVPIKHGYMGPVTYDKRDHMVHEPLPGPVGFVKPKDIYSEQKEFRFLWLTADRRDIQPFLLSCPEVAKLCRIIS